MLNEELLDTEKGGGGRGRWVAGAEVHSDENGSLIGGTSFHLVTLHDCIKSCYTISSLHSHEQILGNVVHLEMFNS